MPRQFQLFVALLSKLPPSRIPILPHFPPQRERRTPRRPSRLNSLECGSRVAAFVFSVPSPDINPRAPAYTLPEAVQVMQLNRALVRFLWVAVIFLAFIGLAVVARRTIVLLHPGALTTRNNPAAALDTHFADHRALTLAHILPAALFMILGPLQFVRRIRSKHPQFHRWSGRVFLTAGAIVGITGLTMAFGKTIGGIDEKAAIILFGTFFLVALAKGLWHAIHRQFAQHREWMIRGYAIGLAVATIRPIMGTFFAAAILRGHTPEPSQFFGTAFWVGFTLQLIAAELWINYTRPSAAAQLAISPAK
jgi:uncharacterized membrane protein